jgi:hypothetical protein
MRRDERMRSLRDSRNARGDRDGGWKSRWGETLGASSRQKATDGVVQGSPLHNARAAQSPMTPRKSSHGFWATARNRCLPVCLRLINLHATFGWCQVSEKTTNFLRLDCREVMIRLGRAHEALRKMRESKDTTKRIDNNFGNRPPRA